MTALPAEFDLIARHFRPLAGQGSLDLSDDAAVFALPVGRELVVSADAMVAGVHFLPDDPPELIARKLLRTNLSDLAAMGAKPFGYLLTISTARSMPDAWFAGFAAGLAVDQVAFGVALLGGDTTSTPGPISLSLTILGTVLPGQAIRRNGARAGDGVWVSGTIGDGALGLLAATDRLADPSGFLARRYRLPQPRLGLAKFGLVAACMDVSDGLVQDLGHLCRASGAGAEIEAARLPLSDAAHAAGQGYLSLCLTGGDDYELLMAIPAAHEAAFAVHSAAMGIAVHRIGRFVSGDPVVRVHDATGGLIDLPRGGWSHFG